MRLGRPTQCTDIRRVLHRPDLYGESVNSSANNSASWRGRMGEMTASAVTASNVSILMHLLGKAPESNGVFLVQNRIIGQVNSAQVTTCSPARCKGTLRPAGCTCTKGAEAGKGSNGAYLLEPKSDQVHTIWQTPSYGMGAVVFSPNDYFSPNSQQRWVGLIFSDFNHTALGMPRTCAAALSTHPRASFSGGLCAVTQI